MGFRINVKKIASQCFIVLFFFVFDFGLALATQNVFSYLLS